MTFDEDTVRRVWAKGGITENADPEIWRRDVCGAWMRWDFFGNLDSQFGWDIDLVVAESEGGTDDLPNLRPVQWQNKVSKDTGRLTCPISASGRYNVRRPRPITSHASPRVEHREK